MSEAAACPVMVENSSDGGFMSGGEEISHEEFLRRERAIKGTEERFLYGENSDEEGWRSEALAVIEDIKQFVTSIDICSDLPCDENGIYLNLETKEAARLTVELSSAGFRVCAHQFDTIGIAPEATPEATHWDEANHSPIALNVYYETPYALLDSISPAYRNSFSTELAQRLMELCK